MTNKDENEHTMDDGINKEIMNDWTKKPDSDDKSRQEWTHHGWWNQQRNYEWVNEGNLTVMASQEWTHNEINNQLIKEEWMSEWKKERNLTVMTCQGSRIFLHPILFVNQPHLKNTRPSSVSFQRRGKEKGRCSRHAQPRDGRPDWVEGAEVGRTVGRCHQHLRQPSLLLLVDLLPPSLPAWSPPPPSPSSPPGGRPPGGAPSAGQMLVLLRKVVWSTCLVAKFKIKWKRQTWVGKLCLHVGQADLGECTWISCNGIRLDSNLKYEDWDHLESWTFMKTSNWTQI